MREMAKEKMMTDTEPACACPYCPRKFQSERGRNVHVGRMHQLCDIHTDEEEEGVEWIGVEDDDDYDEDDNIDEEELALMEAESRLALLDLEVDKVLARWRRGRYANKLASFEYEPAVAAWNKPYEMQCRRNKVALLKAVQPFWDPHRSCFKLPPKELFETLLDCWDAFGNEFGFPEAVEEELTQKRLRYDWAVAMATDNPWWAHLFVPDLTDESVSLPTSGWVTQQTVLRLLRVPKGHQDPIRWGLLTAVINCFILQYGPEVTEFLSADWIFFRATSCVKCKPDGPGKMFWCVFYYLEDVDADLDADWFEGYLAEKRLPPVRPAIKTQIRVDVRAFVAETKTRPPGKLRQKGDSIR